MGTCQHCGAPTDDGADFCGPACEDDYYGSDDDQVDDEDDES